MHRTPVTSSSKNPTATGIPRTYCRAFFFIVNHWVCCRWVCALLHTLCNKFKKKEKIGNFSSLVTQMFLIYMIKIHWYKTFSLRSLWIFPHKDFITLTHLSWAKIIVNKTKHVRKWHQLYVSNQYNTSNLNTTCPTVNMCASSIFNAVRNMCCTEHVDACLPVLMTENIYPHDGKYLLSCQEECWTSWTDSLVWD